LSALGDTVQILSFSAICRLQRRFAVRKKILYVPDRLELDLSLPDLGNPDGMAVLQRHYRQSEQPRSEFNKDRPAFVCLAHEGGTNPGLFLRKVDGQWWAAHYEEGSCRDHRLPAPMSDEHKRQTEYWARAAQDAGWRVDLEHSLATGTRPDALIHGPVLTGVEVRRAAMTPSSAVTRTAKAADAKVTDVWYSGRSGSPPWAWHVPTVLPRELGTGRPADDETWARLPPRRAVAAAGLRVLRTVRCAVGNIDRCPYSRTWCGQHHPRPEPWGGLAVDDVAAKMPAGEIVPLRFWGVTMLRGRRRDAVLLVSPADFALYEEMTGWSGSVLYRREDSNRRPRPLDVAVECQNVQLPAQREEEIWGIDPQTLMWCDCCESRHPVIEHRKCRAVAAEGADDWSA
jgi:hypothetical protein